VQTLLAVVDALREYARNDSNRNGIREYAQKFMSDPGKKNGLCWETKPGEKPSPLGELVAEVRAKGYGGTGSKHTTEVNKRVMTRCATSVSCTVRR
jgi:Protein of unknown function (DUF2950)